ncbi:histidine phosphatase family protein [Paucibacter sp. AS339]|uniref:histidine phosphatase family protein n=1 Tax=Paucibacter hankyongi TaxID=3133434 RepID=UPI00309C3D34
MSLDSSTRILAIRHGETEWNRASRIQGHTDIGLSALGLLQAERLAHALQDEAIDAVYASDLARAQQTASPLLRLRPELPPLQLDVGLRERGFGEFEGLTWQEIADKWPSHSERWRRRDADFGPPGGETLADFYRRSVEAVQRLAQAHPGQTVVVISHGGVLDCLYRASTGQSLQAPRSWVLANAAINRLLYASEGFGLIGWHDCAHLDGLALDEAG